MTESCQNLRLFVIAITGVYPFDENGPALALHAMLNGILKVSHLARDEITMELLVGMSDPKYLDLDLHPLLNVPMVPVLRNLKSINGLETTINGCSKFISKIENAEIIFYNSPPTDVITFAYPFIARLTIKKKTNLLSSWFTSK